MIIGVDTLEIQTEQTAHLPVFMAGSEEPAEPILPRSERLGLSNTERRLLEAEQNKSCSSRRLYF